MTTVLSTCAFFANVAWVGVKNGIVRAVTGTERFAETVRDLASCDMFFVKVFQTVAADHPWLDAEQRVHLRKFCSEVPYSPREIDSGFRTTLRAVESDHPDLAVVLDSDAPAFTGTVAVVYTGKMAGKPVVVKVLRHGIRERLEQSLSRAAVVSAILDRTHGLSLGSTIEGNRDVLLRQADFQHEVQSLVAAQEKIGLVHGVVVPAVYPEFTRRDQTVIVMDRVPGRMALDAVDLLTDDQRAEAVRILSRLIIRSFFYDTTFHSDMHGGNVFIDIAPDTGKVSLGVVDFGATGSISRDSQEALFELWRLVGVEKDWRVAAAHLLDSIVAPTEVVKALAPDKRDELVTSFERCLTPESDTSGNIEPDVLSSLSLLLAPLELHLSPSFCRAQLAIGVVGSLLCRLSNNDKKMWLEDLLALAGETFGEKEIEDSESDTDSETETDSDN